MVTGFDVPGIAVEHQIVEIVKELKRTLKIPVAVKLSPFFAAFANVAHQLDLAGADGLVMFNRFYQPDIDIRTMRPSPQVELSTSAELLLRLRWLAILHGRVRPSLAVTGVRPPNDGIKRCWPEQKLIRTSFPPFSALSLRMDWLTHEGSPFLALSAFRWSIGDIDGRPDGLVCRRNDLRIGRVQTARFGAPGLQAT